VVRRFCAVTHRLNFSCHASRGFGERARPSPSDRASWAIYHIRGTPAQFVGIVYDQPDEKAAIRGAIEEFKVPANQRDRLMAQRRN
jgi:hypothetical protein